MIQPIIKNKLYENVSSQIIEMIKTGAWGEGARIPTEAKLASMFGVGRNSVREAVKSLQLSGILVSSPGLGTFITQNAFQKIRNSELLGLLSSGEYLTDLIETRLALETNLARLAALRATPENIRGLEKTLEEMRRCQDKNVLVEQGYRFHTQIAESTGNKILIGFYQSIASQLLSQRDMDFLTLEIYQRDIGEHAAILEAIREQDGEKAMSLMEQHLQKDYGGYLEEKGRVQQYQE